jgi:hypothetical protein
MSDDKSTRIVQQFTTLVKADRNEFTFVVRMWLRDENAESQWRGSVHEVSSGRKRFICGTRDVAEFIASFLRAEPRAD